MTKTTKVTHVSLKIKKSGYNLHPVSYFVNLPFNERMRFISENRVSFLDEHGEQMSMLEGVRFICDLLKKR